MDETQTKRAQPPASRFGKKPGGKIRPKRKRREGDKNKLETCSPKLDGENSFDRLKGDGMLKEEAEPWTKN